MTYLERYTNGEYEPVWNELQALGPAVRQEPVYSDALAVARETMGRARHTIEELIQRLIRIGFVFGYDHPLIPLRRATSIGIDDSADSPERFACAPAQSP